MSSLSLERLSIQLPKAFNSMPIQFQQLQWPPRMHRFRRGDQVEVASLEEGFVGSYYEASTVTDLVRNEYMVQYRTVVKDDLSGPLMREVATTAEVRPRPPKIPAAGFSLHDVVDAFDNDGWWVGKITGWHEDGGYFVYFQNTGGDEIAYPRNRIRIHQEWVNGK